MLTRGVKVRPRPGVFQDTVRYLLVVTTPVEVVLLAVSSSGDTSGQIALLPSIELLAFLVYQRRQVPATNESFFFFS